MDIHTAHACVECDLLIAFPSNLEHRHNAVCPRCNHQITSGHSRARQAILALSITSTIVLAIACLFPFISFSANGQLRTIGLLQAIIELADQGFYFVAISVSLFIVLLPLVYISFMIALLLGTYLKMSKLIKRRLVKSITYVLPWAMAEVFLVGVLVALIKVISLAEVSLELAFWAYAIFAPLFVYITSLADNHRLWSWVEYEE